MRIIKLQRIDLGNSSIVRVTYKMLFKTKIRDIVIDNSFEKVKFYKWADDNDRVDHTSIESFYESGAKEYIVNGKFKKETNENQKVWKKLFNAFTKTKKSNVLVKNILK